MKGAMMNEDLYNLLEGLKELSAILEYDYKRVENENPTKEVIAGGIIGAKYRVDAMIRDTMASLDKMAEEMGAYYEN